TYDYQFDVAFADGSSVSFEDMDQQDATGGGASRIIIAPFTAVWNVSGLSDGSYGVRAVAKDSRGISDSAPAIFSLSVDNSAPASVSILSPAENERIDTSAGIDLYAQVADTADTENAYAYFMYSLDGGYIWTRIANEDTTDDEWTQNWGAMAFSNDINNCLIKAVAVDEAGNFRESAVRNVILDATDPEILSFEMNSSISTEINLNMGTAYTWSVTTLSPDIDNLEITLGGGIPAANYRWSPANTVTSWTGAGTAADPYRFSGTVCLNVTVFVDNQQEVFTATLEDKSGRTDAVTKNVNYKDVTPNPASIVAVDGLEVRSGDALVTAGELITVKYRAANTDSGVIYYQYKASASPDWLTFAGDTAVGESATTVTNTANFPPAGITLSNGSYDLRALAVDDDGNADPSPVTVTITVDTVLPIVKPAAITEISAAGVISMIEYDELVNAAGSSEINVEYRVPGSSWTYWSGSTKGAAIGEAGDLWTCDTNFAPVSGIYELRAICVESGGLEQDDSIAPVYSVEVKRDSAGNVIVYKTTAKLMNLALSNVTLGSTYAGTELTATGTLEIKSAQALTNITVRLMTTDGVTNVDRYLTVIGAASPYTASVDMSEIMENDGNVRILVTAIDASGNYISEDMIIASESSAFQPDGANLNVGRIVDVDFNANLENESTLIVYQASTSAVPSTQASIVTALVGEPWEFVLSEPEAFQTSNTCDITFSYRDNELAGADETKLGVAYWDTVNSRWSSEGITNVNRDIVNNTVDFRTSHFTKFQLAIIDAAPAVAFVSPGDGGMAGKSPIIEADILDGFSAIREVKVLLDGVDRTASFDDEAYRDGIDNDGNGLVDENIVNANADVEEALNTSGATAAKYKVRPGLQLSDGSHTLAITATNEQGISTTQSISFTVGGAVGINSAFIAPNPYDPSSGDDAQIKVNMTADAFVTLKVYDFGGKLVYTSKTNSLSNGNDVFWNGRTDGNKLLANGVYLIRIEAGTSQGTDSKVIKAALLR
ncbi:MAG: FlgD immunoglobulin-like domain containing protein, partial [Candidatus Omnitrophota bacterium]